jgi:cytochrome c1
MQRPGLKKLFLREALLIVGPLCAAICFPACMSKKVDPPTGTDTNTAVARNTNNPPGYTYTYTSTSTSSYSSTNTITSTSTSSSTISSISSVTNSATATATATGSVTSTATVTGSNTKTVTTTATATGVDGPTAFKSTVYPLATMHCAACHANTIQPYFANSDPLTAYNSVTAAGKVDLTNPANSRLVLRLSADHHYCWSTDCNADASEMLAAITSWKNMVATPVTPPPSSGSSTRYNTITVPIPATIPNGGTTLTTLTWPLDSPNDTISPEITGATFSIDIQQFDAYSYKLKNPKIKAPNGNVYVWDIRLAINGTIRTNDVTFSLVDQMVPKNTTGMLLSPSSMVMLIDKGAGTDKLAASFAQIRNISSVACKNLTGFTASVKPVMTASCVNCHGATNVFDMSSGTDADICMRTLGRVDLGTPANSLLITKPTTGTSHAGGGNLINSATVTNWINWINSER